MNLARCLGAAMAGVWLLGCGEAGVKAGGGKGERYRVVTTVGMVRDIVGRVAGERAEVSGLIGTGVDPHLYKPTRDDVERLMGADVVFYSGLMLEGKMADVLVKVGREKPVFAVTERIEEQYLLQPAEFAGHFDPHVWMDASAWAKCAEAAGEALGEYDGAHREEYTARAKATAEELMGLHEYGKRSIGSIPEGKRVLITSHDAFNYFGRAYGLEVLGVQGISTESEAGLADINRLVDVVVQRGVEAVFVESSVPAKNIQALVDGARARGKKVKIGGELYSDAMGAEGTYEGTYVGMLDHNITVVTRALGGTAPEGGMQGKLRPVEERAG